MLRHFSRHKPVTYYYTDGHRFVNNGTCHMDSLPMQVFFRRPTLHFRPREPKSRIGPDLTTCPERCPLKSRPCLQLSLVVQLFLLKIP